jgi:hypothetical protein
VNVYYDPEKFGLQLIGEVDYSSGAYEFDLTVVWREMTSGRLVYADDSGCSCPSPFSDVGISDMTAGQPHDVARHLHRRIEQTCNGNESHEGCYCGENRSKVLALVERVRDAARQQPAAVVLPLAETTN